jgi:hypothetical protein
MTDPTTRPEPIVDQADATLRLFGDTPTRSQAATLLSMWRYRPLMSDAEVLEVLDRFGPPQSVTGHAATTSAFLAQARHAFDTAARAHLTWRTMICTVEDLSGARDVLGAIDEALAQLTGCREALAAYIEERT